MAEYVVEQAMKEQEKLDAMNELSGREELLLDPSTHFDERFEAVIVDMLHGRHASQIDSSGAGLNQNPEEHETNDDNPTNDY